MNDYFQQQNPWTVAATSMGGGDALQALLRQRMMQQQARQWQQEQGLREREFGLQQQEFGARQPYQQALTKQLGAQTAETEFRTKHEQELAKKAGLIGALQQMHMQLASAPQSGPVNMGAKFANPMEAPAGPNGETIGMMAKFQKALQAMNTMGVPNQFPQGMSSEQMNQQFVDPIQKGMQTSVAMESPSEAGRMLMAPEHEQYLLQMLMARLVEQQQLAWQRLGVQQSEGQANRAERLQAAEILANPRIAANQETAVHHQATETAIQRARRLEAERSKVTQGGQGDEQPVTATNPTTGQKRQLKDGQWIPIQQ